MTPAGADDGSDGGPAGDDGIDDDADDGENRRRFSRADDDEVASVIDGYVSGVLERNPQVATAVGVHDHDGAVPAADAAAVEEEIAAARGALEALPEPDDCDPRDRWTVRVSRAALEHDLVVMERVERWRMDPDAADGIASLIYPLYLRPFAPLPERLELIAERLEDCPDYVEDVMARVDDPVATWVERERRSVEELPGLLRLLADEAGELERQDVAYRLNAAVGDVMEALEEYDDWLAGLDGREDWRLADGVYADLLAQRRLPDPDEAREVADEALDHATARLQEAVEELGVDEPEDGAAVVREDHPESPEDVVDAYVAEAGALRDVVRDEALAPLPSDGGVAVEETPAHAAPLILATGYLGPAAFAAPGASPGDGSGERPRYLVTTPAEEGLPTHNAGAVASSVAGDLFPGHHLQQVTAVRSAPRIPLVTGHFGAFGDDLVEGWRLHAARLVGATDHGDAAFRLVAARNAVEAACLARIDVDLHTGAKSIRDAASYLVDEAGLERESAVAEARATTRSPGHRLATCVGAARLRALRDDAGAAGMEDAELHDAVLERGRAPVAMLRDAVLSDEG